MNDVFCPRCGVKNPGASAFCGACGAPLVPQPSTPAESALATAPPTAIQVPPPPPNPYPPPPNAYAPPPPGAYPPPPGAYPPPAGVYPPGYPAAKVVGDNTKWAVGLGIAALFCCGPFTGIPGIFLAKKDMDEIAAGRAPHLDDGWAKGAFYLNIIALGLFVLGICLFWGGAGLRRF